jgi:tripartite-type tricarboxylate transporter receptor subunit TctC
MKLRPNNCDGVPSLLTLRGLSARDPSREETSMLAPVRIAPQPHAPARRWLSAAFLLAVVLPACCIPAVAQDYPVKPLRIVLPFAAGGGTDLLARLLAQRFHESMGQPVTVDNRIGAGGNIGAEIVTKSPPDGYTLLVSTASTAVNVSLYPKLAFDARRDLIAVSQLGSSAVVLTVHPSVPARSPQELVALSKRVKGGLNYGSNGTGTTSHLAGVLFAQVAGIQLTHIPYKGVAPAMAALLGGQVELGFPSTLSAQPLIRSGKARGLAVTTKKRAASLPDLPTLDSFWPGIDIDNWFMLFVPANTPAAVVKRLHAETVKALQHPDMTGYMSREGAESVGSSPAQAREFFAREVEKYARIVKAAQIKVD